MRLLHLTDTHLYGDPAARHYDRIDTAAALRGLLDRLGTLRDIDAVVHTGDASEDGTAQSYRLLHEILDPFAASLDAPLAVVMGNHDVSAVYGETVVPGERLPAAQDRVVPLPRDGRLIVLDSSVPGAGYGHLAPEQLDWLREQLAVRPPAAACWRSTIRRWSPRQPCCGAWTWTASTRSPPCSRARTSPSCSRGTTTTR